MISSDFKRDVFELYEDKFGDKPDLAIEMAELFLERIEEELNIAQSEIDKAKQSIPSDEWFGSKVDLDASLSSFSKEMDWSDDFGYVPRYNLECSVGDKASMTVFVHNDIIQIDDVLDAGDTDFFESDEVQADYFNLVNAIRNHGQRAKSKIMTLYTARPKKDQSSFVNSNTVPTNIFLTSSYDEAQGYAMDMGERDIYKIRIKSGYLVKTLDTPSVKNYQAIHKSNQVPVESIELL